MAIPQGRVLERIQGKLFVLSRDLTVQISWPFECCLTCFSLFVFYLVLCVENATFLVDCLRALTVENFACALERIVARGCHFFNCACWWISYINLWFLKVKLWEVSFFFFASLLPRHMCWLSLLNLFQEFSPVEFLQVSLLFRWRFEHLGSLRRLWLLSFVYGMMSRRLLSARIINIGVMSRWLLSARIINIGMMSWRLLSARTINIGVMSQWLLSVRIINIGVMSRRLLSARIIPATFVDSVFPDDFCQLRLSSIVRRLWDFICPFSCFDFLFGGWFVEYAPSEPLTRLTFRAPSRFVESTLSEPLTRLTFRAPSRFVDSRGYCSSTWTK